MPGGRYGPPTLRRLDTRCARGTDSTACDPGGPPSATGTDLVPIPHIFSFDPPHSSFCKRGEEGLEITVRNQGDGYAGPSITRIDFGSAGGHVDRNTDAMHPLEFDELTVPIPLGCFNPNCDFTITVDQATTVDEGGDEGNNQVSDSCIG